jgi:undecaprenyl pyrophosphate synthase
MIANRELLLQALKSHAEGHIEKHKANIEIYLNQSIGIGEHSDIIETIEKELNKIAVYEDQLEILEKHFKQTLN